MNPSAEDCSSAVNNYTVLNGLQGSVAYKGIHGPSLAVMLKTRTFLPGHVDQLGKLIALIVKTSTLAQEDLQVSP